MSKDFVATHTVVRDTPYYETGPQQGRPPDGELKAGTMVRDFGTPIGGYLQVRTREGLECYVDGSDLTLVK